ncbi:hypothetical protein [Roseovarius sp.]|uniref:hypothetical protein n=1 Tax=Roseovarius sp. TaxID=1486281 RepID=UPI0025D759DD|nr:hypothetical protein [Roseovarius sp.]
MRLPVWTLLPLLAACNTPGQEFRGIDPVRVSIAQSTFDVRVDGTYAQAIRLNREWAPRFEAVAPRGAAAIQKVSGCRVTRLWGDQAVMLARLDCGAGAPPLPPGPAYYCELDHIHGAYADLICLPRP